LIVENHKRVTFESIGLSPIYFRTKRQSKADKMRATHAQKTHAARLLRREECDSSRNARGAML